MRSQTVMLAAGVAMIAAAAAIVVHRRSAALKPAAPAAPASPAATASPSAVRLLVERDGAAMRLHWNPNVAQIRDASPGALIIHDGDRASTLRLSPAELRSGVASYWPESHEVTFRLQLDNGLAGEMKAPVTPRPSPFEPVRKAPRVRQAASSLGTAPARRDEANATAATAPGRPVRKRSRLRRFAGRIPLVRRLDKDR